MRGSWQDLFRRGLEFNQDRTEFNGFNFRNKLIAVDKNWSKHETSRYSINEDIFSDEVSSKLKLYIDT